jgi:hypothetical protein
MAGQEQAALVQLGKMLRQESANVLDRAAILLTKAELLYLGGRYRDSHDVFVNELDLLIRELPHAVALVIGFNRSDVAMALFDSSGALRFYDLLDEQRIAGIEHWDDSAMLSATSNAARGRSYESLPVIWRELRRSFQQGRWAVFRHVSRYMADECLRIGLPQEAAFHAVNALDTEFAKRIGLMLLNSRDAAAVEATITKLLLTANLQKHFIVACKLVQELSDVVPDSLVDRLIGWVLLRCATNERPEGFNSLETTAWETVGSLASRASTDTAKRIVAVALSREAWNARAERSNQFIPVREEIIDAINQAVVALPIESLQELADATIPLATERRNFKDFNNAINLLIHITHRASDEVKAKISSALYVPGQPIPPPLMQAAPYFGKDILNDDNQLESYATQVANSIRQAVQRIPTGEEPKPVDGTVMTWHSERDNGKLVVHLISTQSVWGLARNRRQVPVESRNAVITALLEAIANPDNLLENKISFIQCLKGFADSLDASLAAEVFRVLAPIANGDIEISAEISSSMGQAHPLSRVRITNATAEQVSAQALFVLARIENSFPGSYGARLQVIVRKALGSKSSEIRKCAFAAVREIPTIAESTWMPLLLGTRDPDDEAAALAFDAISTKQDAHFTHSQWKMAAYSLRIAQLSTSIKLRKAAAKAASRLELQAPSKTLRAELSAIRGVFANDIAHSVRVAANTSQELVETT